MPTLYRPSCSTYKLRGGACRTPDGKRVTARTPGAVRHASQSRTWWGRYTDGAGVRHQVRLSASKETARRMLAKLAGDAQLAGVGISDPFAEHRGRPLLEHLGDFRRSLVARDVTARHVHNVAAGARAVVEGCGFRNACDVEAGAVLDFLAGLRRDRPAPKLDPAKEWYSSTEAAAVLGVTRNAVQQATRFGRVSGPPVRRGRGRPLRLHRDTLAGMIERRCRGVGPRTSNCYLAAAKAFTKWLARERRAPLDPLAHLSALNVDADVRHQRRPLDAAEFARFVEATAAGPVHYGLSGAQRLVLYCVSARTGLRARELASLTPESFDLDAAPPQMRVGAAYSKHRREDVLPLRPDVAELVRGYLAGVRPREPLWPGGWHSDGAAMVRDDLARAGLPYEDGRGRVFDFHALRHTFLTHLAESRVHPKVAQVLARHSTISLTLDRYTHLEALDVAGDLEKLPDLPLPAAAREKPAGRCKARARRGRY